MLIVERGEQVGSKNMTGGRIYAHSLHKVFDAHGDEVVWDDIPFERKITYERIALMDPTSQMCIDFTSKELAEKANESYSVLRAAFDPWLAQLCESAGCEIISGIVVEELVKDDRGAVVGIKEVFELPAQTIEDRFLCPEGEGASMLFVGDCTHGAIGGGFLYTNKESISLELVATIQELSESDTTICPAMEDFKHHPAIAPIIRDATLVEHSGHMVSEGGYDMIPQYIHDGCLIAGGAAMLCMNLGYQVRGMDFAVASGQFAAEAACEAIDAGNVSSSGLASYRALLENSFVIQDLKTFRAWPSTMEHWTRMFAEYPAMVTDIFNAMFVVDGHPQEHLTKRVVPLLKERGLMKLAREVRGALRAL